MTKEESINRLRAYSYGATDEAKEAFEMAIKALEKKRCN